VTGKWHIDETYIKVRGQWMYLYRGLLAAKRFLRKAPKRHGRPDRVVIDGSQTNHEAIISCDTTNRLQDRPRRGLKPIRIRKSQYLNNRIEQDHRRIKCRIRSMLGFTSQASAAIILDGIEMVHMMRKRQARFAFNPAPSIRGDLARKSVAAGGADPKLTVDPADLATVEKLAQDEGLASDELLLGWYNVRRNTSISTSGKP